MGTIGAHLSEENVLGNKFGTGDILPLGRYVAKGDVIYNNMNYPSGSIVAVTTEGTTFVSDATDYTDPILVEILDPNIADVCYLRSTPAIYAIITCNDGLQRGGIYYNFGTRPIQYRGRTVAPGESFVAANNTDSFTPPEDMPLYKIGVMFDDSRVPSQEWIPAQLFGQYFVYKVNGVIKLDDDGKPISSGNNLSYQPKSQGGYSDVLRKSMMGERYCQFRIIASKQ